MCGRPLHMRRPEDDVRNSSSGVPYFGFSGRVSHWVWSLLSWLGWLVSESLGSVCLSPQCWGHRCGHYHAWHFRSVLESHSGLCECKASNWQTKSSPQHNILDTEWTHGSLPCSPRAPACLCSLKVLKVLVKSHSHTLLRYRKYRSLNIEGTVTWP